MAHLTRYERNLTIDKLALIEAGVKKKCQVDNAHAPLAIVWKTLGIPWLMRVCLSLKNGPRPQSASQLPDYSRS